MQIDTLTGPSDNVPQDADAGKATAKAINAAGGINGHPIQLEVCDDKFDPNAAAACARQAVSDQVVAVVALNSAFGGNVIPILAAANIPSVGDNLISAAEFTSKDVFPIDGGAITGSAAMAYADAVAGAKKLRPVLVDVAAAKGLLPFVQGVTKLFPGVTMLTDVDVPAQATDVTSQAAAATAGGADGAFFVVGAGAAAPLTRAMRTAGFTGYLATSTQSITDQEIKDLGQPGDRPAARERHAAAVLHPERFGRRRSTKDMSAAGVTARSGGMLLAWASLKVTADGAGQGDHHGRPRPDPGAEQLRRVRLPRTRQVGLHRSRCAAEGGRCGSSIPTHTSRRSMRNGNVVPIRPRSVRHHVGAHPIGVLLPEGPPPGPSGGSRNKRR